MRLILLGLLTIVSLNAGATKLNADARITFDNATTRSDGSPLAAADIAQTMASVTASGGAQAIELTDELMSLTIDVNRDDLLDDGQFTVVFDVYHVDNAGRIGDSVTVSEVVTVSQALIDFINNGLRPGRVINLDVRINITGIQ